MNNSIFNPIFSTKIKPKTYIYSCDCGFSRNNDMRTSYRCPLCGTIIGRHIVESFEDLDPNNDIIEIANMDLYHMNIGIEINSAVSKECYMPMAEIYCNEIGKIRKQYDVYADAMSKKEKEYRCAYDEFMNAQGIVQRIAEIKAKIRTCTAEFESCTELASAMLGGSEKYLIKAIGINDEINKLKKQLSELNDNMQIANKIFISNFDINFEELPEYKVMCKLKDMAFNYAKRINDDFNKYFDYIDIIHYLINGTEIGKCAMALDFMECKISDEDDKYISSINSEYVSYKYYRQIASALLHKNHMRKELIEKSRAREVKIADPGIMDYAIETDPYTRLVNRTIVEHQIIDDIMNFGSINCTLI